MLKKMILFTAACLAMTTAACSDDKPEICNQDDYKTHCDGDTLLYCGNNNRITKDECDYGCDSKTLRCKESTPSTPSTPSEPSRPSRPSDPSNPDNPSNPGVNECGSITAAGICDGNVAKRCVNNKIQSQTCTSGQKCGTRSDGSVDCITDSTPQQPTYKDGDPCPKNITDLGICNGKQLIYCSRENKLVVENCTQGCILDDSDEFAICYEPCPADLTGVGKCFDNDTVMKYCHEDKGLITRYCSEGYSCQHYKDDQYDYYECFEITDAKKPGDETMPMPKPEPEES